MPQNITNTFDCLTIAHSNVSVIEVDIAVLDIVRSIMYV